MDDIVAAVSGLFSHKYDIDEIIAAMLSGRTSVLDTNTGKISAANPEDKEQYYL